MPAKKTTAKPKAPKPKTANPKAPKVSGSGAPARVLGPGGFSK